MLILQCWHISDIDIKKKYNIYYATSKTDCFVRFRTRTLRFSSPQIHSVSPAGTPSMLANCLLWISALPLLSLWLIPDQFLTDQVTPDGEESGEDPYLEGCSAAGPTEGWGVGELLDCKVKGSQSILVRPKKEANPNFTCRLRRLRRRGLRTKITFPSERWKS